MKMKWEDKLDYFLKNEMQMDSIHSFNADLSMEHLLRERHCPGTGDPSPHRTFTLLWSPTFLAPGMIFMEDNFSRDQRVGDGLGLIQAHDMFCALHFYYYYIGFISDHQALLDPRGWGPLL